MRRISIKMIMEISMPPLRMKQLIWMSWWTTLTSWKGRSIGARRSARSCDCPALQSSAFEKKGLCIVFVLHVLLILHHFTCDMQLLEFKLLEIYKLTWVIKFLDLTSSTAQGGGGSFKNRKPIGEVGCCESGMAKRIHWWTERCLRSPLCLSFSLTIYLPTSLSSMYLSIYLSLSFSFI